MSRVQASTLVSIARHNIVGLAYLTALLSQTGVAYLGGAEGPAFSWLHEMASPTERVRFIWYKMQDAVTPCGNRIL